MAKDSKFLAIDFGAESGRALLGIIENDKIRLEEVHRFPNGPVGILGHIHWDVLRQFSEVKQGLRLALQQTDGDIDGIGVDTWGVDFALLGEDGELLGNPFHYRDARTEGMMDEVFKIVPKEEVYQQTGNQFIQLNTLYQLYAMVLENSTALKCADTLLMMPELFNYWLTGRKVSEFTIATTSQCYNPRTGDWARDMLAKLNIPTDIFPQIIKPGTVIGPLAESLVDEMGMGKGIPVIASACHDTASAVAAVPATGEGHVYISSGTWSLLGIEIRKPLINEKALGMNFTNEGGVSDTFRFLHNIMGLWIVQECRRTWLAAGEEISYGELADMAAESEGYVSVINPDSPIFLPPGDMPQRIREFCKETDQPIPTTKGEVIRCVLDSLALCYRTAVEALDDLIGIHHNPIHIVGGGTQNQLLCQLTADVSGRKVIAGPIEATAIGNVLVQAMGRGFISSIEEARQIVRNSFDLIEYEPHDNPAISKAYNTYKKITG